MKAGIYTLLSLAALVGMYIAFLYLGDSPNQFSLTIGILGASAGFFASKASSVKNDNQLERILSAALIKEKEVEAKTVEEAKELYEKELSNLKEIIEKEGNLLLLRRMREVYLSDIKEKIREIDSIDNSLLLIGETKSAPEVEKIRKRLEGLLTGVRNPEEDDRLIRQFCYSLPMLGNMIYFVYSLWKKVDPTLQDKVHRKLNELAIGNNGDKPFLKLLSFLGIAVFIIGLLTVVAFVANRFFHFFNW
jgi:vacuolar-type H+-ATPase subunit H